MAIYGLLSIFIIILFAPFLVKKVEEQLEIFFFIMGCMAVSVTAQWNKGLIIEACFEPLKITVAVFIAGILFMAFQKQLAGSVAAAARACGVKLFAFILIVALGFLSSVITAIIAALVLATIIAHLRLARKYEVMLAVLSCFSIGLGAALTPLGEPLSTIVIAKLKPAPYHADFFFLFRHLWRYIIPGMFACGLLGFFLMPGKFAGHTADYADKKEDLKDVVLRTAKVYLFVLALVLLGRGFKPLIDTYISRMPFEGLFWANMSSALLDNATLAAAEIGPALGLLQIKSALLGLLIAGGMLIPGNIPNIIIAGKFKISNSEWAKAGVPLGLAGMLIYFLALFFFS